MCEQSIKIKKIKNKNKTELDKRATLLPQTHRDTTPAPHTFVDTVY